MVPFQLDISKSSPSESPYEHASAGISAGETLASWITPPTRTQPFLALLKLFKQAEVPGYFGTHVGQSPITTVVSTPLPRQCAASWGI